MNLLTEFARTCAAWPERVALVQDGRTLSYGDLSGRVLGLAGVLREKSLDQKPIAIALDRGIDAAIAILAVIWAGKCYLPLDTKNPRPRLDKIIQDSGASLVIGGRERPDWLDPRVGWLDIEKLNQSPFADPEPALVDAESLAAILYTSGSTGTPKGVALSHRALLSFSDWAAKTFAIGTSDRIASLAPFHFDLSVFDLFSGLSSGAQIHFVPANLILSPSRLSAWLEQHAISTWYTVPSMLNFLAFKGGLAEINLKSLKSLLFAGEVMPPTTLIQLTRLLPATRFYNLFGPTESNVCCYWPVDPAYLSANQPIPIGQAACASELSISAAGGELLVRGPNLFSGYWSRGKLCEPLDPQAWYASGDRVSMGEDGNFYFHGRIDRMLKCSGYRVEPAEIEAVIRGISFVEACAAVGIADPTSGTRPAAAVVLRAGRDLEDLLAAVKTTLPVYMRPVKFVFLEALPRLSNGKTDYLEIERRLSDRG